MDAKHPDMKAPRPNKKPGPGPRGDAFAFDLWLKRGLHEMYDDITKEPVPEELLKLIEDDRSDPET